MKKGTPHLGSAHSTARPARPSGPAPLGISARDRRNKGRGSGLGVTPVDGDPDLGRRAAGGSPWRAHGGDGRWWRGAPVRGSAGCRWFGWWGQWAPQSSGDSTGGVDGAGGAPEVAIGGGRWSGGSAADDKLASGPEVHDASSSEVLRREGKVGVWFLVRTTTGWSGNGGDGELTRQQKSQICTLIDHVTENTFSFMSVA
jgi:hypothetical protein